MAPPRDLPLEEKVGQLLWIGFQGTTMNPALRSLLERVRPGGLILFSRNIETAGQVRRLTDALFGATRIPPFIALDQEGGRVSRLKSILGPTQTPFDLARRARPETAVRLQASATAAALKSLGFNVNFAPVLDLSGPDPANGIGDPAFQGHNITPATLAPEIVDALLRRRIGFRGLILTDDLEMGAVDQEEGAATQALRALAAGNDGLMFCSSEARIVEARDAVLAAVQDGDVEPARIDRSVRRVLR